MSDTEDELRAERNHWIGEASWYKRLYETEAGHAPMWFRRMRVAEAKVARVEAVLTDEWRHEPPTPAYPEGREMYRWPAAIRDELRGALEGNRDA